MRVAGKYGAVAGVILAIALIVLYYLDRHPLMIKIWYDLRILIFILFIFFAIKEFKEDVNKRILHFWQGLSISIIVYSLAAFIASIVIWIFAKWIDPGFVQSFIDLSIEGLQRDKELIIESLGERRFNAAIENLPSTTAGNLAFDYFLKSFPIGLLLTLIITLFMRSNPKLT